jgi:hypothetical protein
MSSGGLELRDFVRDLKLKLALNLLKKIKFRYYSKQTIKKIPLRRSKSTLLRVHAKAAGIL